MSETPTPILDRLPSYIPKSELRVEETFEFVEYSDGTPQTVYVPDKSPFARLRSVIATVDDSETSLTVGDDVIAADTVGDEYRKISFINSESYPDFGTEFTVTYDAEPVIARYANSFTDDLASLESSLNTAFDAKYVDQASGQGLDLIGGQFGDIGRRRGRNDKEYRTFLRSVISAFNATGTKEDISFAVASAIRGDPDEVSVNENIEQTGFTVRIASTDRTFVTKSLNGLVSIASPSGVELLQPVVFEGDDNILQISHSSSVTSRTYGLGSSQLSSDTLD